MRHRVKVPQMSPNQLTVWEYPQSTMHTQWGVLRFDAWCEKEMDRLKRLGISAAVKTTDNGLCCIERV